MVFPKLTLADQKLVSFNDFPFGRSKINRPSCELSQKPPLTASEVQTYVFCCAPWAQCDTGVIGNDYSQANRSR